MTMLTAVLVYNGGGQDDLENWDGQYNGQGYPTVKTGGLHYNNKWNDEKESINGNYKIMQLNVNGVNTGYQQPVHSAGHTVL